MRILWRVVAVVSVVLRLCDAFMIPARAGSKCLQPCGNIQESVAIRRSITTFHDNLFRQSSALKFSANDEAPRSLETKPPKLFSIGMFLFPVATLVFDSLLQLARSLPPSSSEQLAAVAVLFVSNRVYLYLLAVTIVVLAATRGATDSPQLGRRITDLTEELLYRPSLDKGTTGALTTTRESQAMDDSQPSDKPALIQSLTTSGLEESLDQISTETQALILPLLVSFFLALSVFLLPFWTGSPPLVGETSSLGRDFSNLLSTLVPTISQLWNLGLLTIFTRSEIRRLCYELQWFPDLVLIEWVAAMSITGLAYWGQLWPAQNFVNMALAITITVSRAIQLNSFPAVVGALGLLTVYDATSVFLIPAANAISYLSLLEASNAIVSTSSSLSSSSLLSSSVDGASVGGSAMGSVALQKLTSGTFQPGLLVTKIGSNLGGTLGLGDAVFPALLATFVQRFDNFQQSRPTTKRQVSLLTVSIIGYLLGCLACEFAPSLSTSGLPALVFIIPSMLVSVVITSAFTGQLGELVEFDPNKER